MPPRSSLPRGRNRLASRYNPRRIVNDAEELKADAIAKARQLVADLQKQSAEMQTSPSAEGKQAVADALAAAQTLLKTLEDE